MCRRMPHEFYLIKCKINTKISLTLFRNAVLYFSVIHLLYNVIALLYATVLSIRAVFGEAVSTTSTTRLNSLANDLPGKSWHRRLKTGIYNRAKQKTEVHAILIAFSNQLSIVQELIELAERQ